jgi:hypothetical protein
VFLVSGLNQIWLGGLFSFSTKKGHKLILAMSTQPITRLRDFSRYKSCIIKSCCPIGFGNFFFFLAASVARPALMIALLLLLLLLLLFFSRL